MASAVIHLAVANEINKKINRDKSKLLIGAIAPDISKIIGDTKEKSHFLDNLDTSIPNLGKFLDKYKNKLNDDFVMGYYIHLYTDYLWFKYFVTEIIENDRITKKDGTIVRLNGEMASLYIYNDYTNLNVQLLDEYDMDLKIFYNEVPKLDNIINEIPMDKIDLLMDKIGLIIANTKVNKSFVFDIRDIKKFISTSTELILAEIDKMC